MKINGYVHAAQFVFFYVSKLQNTSGPVNLAESFSSFRVIPNLTNTFPSFSVFSKPLKEFMHTIYIQLPSIDCQAEELSFTRASISTVAQSSYSHLS